MFAFFKISKEFLSLKSFILSIGIHTILFLIFLFLFEVSIDESRISNPYIEMFTVQTEGKQIIEEETPDDLDKSEIENPIEADNLDSPKETDAYYDFSTVDTDTSKLQQVYKENTLDVSIKYPAGWTYVDQNVSNKLDGITFWSVKSKFNPPPYIHIEVKEKYLFNSNRFEHSLKMNNYIAYYNNPEELAGQVSQTIYIRTETDEDFSIKLIMKGEEEFRSFQPVFFSMLRTFKFKNKFF